ncbi:MAG: hypothetical protein AMJ54_12860 [Deltaproteobacteria bacterium SG8_13]|nr:MAG: hypothetical protein AMJ54_12860 [Deltaproteobacteria bacterium SG8_13]
MEIKQPAAHLDQMMRQTRAHHVQLSLMADSKANMILTVASLLIPLSIQYLNDPKFKAAAMIMIAFCVLTVVLAAYAAMPKLKLEKNRNDREVRKGFPLNPLFFGSFVQMGYEQYEQVMEELMNDHNRSYQAQVREVYLLGQYLHRKKYFFVRLAYLAFISGAIISSSVYIAQAYL